MSSAWSAARQQGFALAASAHDDRGAERALGGLSPELVEQAAQHARSLAGLDRAARRRWVRELLSVGGTAPALRGGAALGGTAPALRGGAALGPQPADRPPRALGLLAGEVARELGRSWLAASAAPRPGFVPEPQLLALLRGLCTAQVAGNEEP